MSRRTSEANKAILVAWNKEQELVREGEGTRDWTPEQQQDILDNGIIKLKDGAGINATVNDIEENPHNVEIVELEAAQVARVVNETAYVVLNGNYALAAGFSVGKDALAYEQNDSEAAKTYVNVIAVKEGNENNEAIKALVDVLKSDDVKNYIKETYDGAVLPYEE